MQSDIEGMNGLQGVGSPRGGGPVCMKCKRIQFGVLRGSRGFLRSEQRLLSRFIHPGELAVPQGTRTCPPLLGTIYHVSSSL